ncbi:MAG: NFACT RNA binding domain-containing protein [Candidatus Aminicenantes bacterium]|nr:NFACT RNA binding domain-containing protein [Candidatus Aminicenantes bacterium]
MINGKPASNVKDARLIEYTLEDQWTVLVGRTEKDNDTLSLKIAKANDWWFHVRGMSGSHVVLKVPAGEDPDKNILKMAASIAAYHSKARTGGIVAVSCTRARYVTKPHGAKPGTVQIRKEIILKVRPGLGEALVSEQSSKSPPE